MRFLVTILCVFLCAAVTTTPFTHLHAHVGHDQQATEVHGGHQHEFDLGTSDHGDHDQDHVVYLSAGASPLSSSDVPLVPWLPLLYVVAVLLMVEPLRRQLPSPRYRAARLPSQYPPWPPPLRGPPVSI